MVPEFQDKTIREVFLASYRIVYWVTDDRVDVLAVIHGARDLEDMHIV